MAKVVFKKTPHSAYEWAEVQGGETMKDHERAALLDEFVAENGLVPVETIFQGDVPTHKYGRYIAGGVAASALPPALPGRENDLIKANDELAAARSEIARLQAQLGKQPEKSKAEVVDAPLPIVAPAPIGTSGGGGQTTEDARATLSQGAAPVLPTSEQVREDNSTSDRSTDNQVEEEPAKTRGRPKKAD